MSKFLEVHVIQNLPPSNVNRDDTGAPKAAIYGGVNRLRVSSQAWKRATREEFASRIQEPLRATRTKRVTRMLADRIVARQAMSEEQAGELAQKVLAAAGVKVAAPRVAKGQSVAAADHEAEALFFISNQQLGRLAELAVQGDGEVDKKAAKAAIDQEHGAEIALFGRMVASSPDLTVDAAVQVAHAISTHAVDPQGDFYTAVDDAKPHDDDSGAGMMGTIEFASATLYRYAAIALDQLLENLGDGQVAAETAAEFVRGFALSIPSGKKNSFAADTLPSLVLVTVRDGRPVNLVGAFEKPVRTSDEGYVAASTQRLVDQVAALESTFAVPAEASWLVAEPALADVTAPLGSAIALPAALDGVRESVLRILGGERS